MLACGNIADEFYSNFILNLELHIQRCFVHVLEEDVFRQIVSSLASVDVDAFVLKNGLIGWHFQEKTKEPNNNHADTDFEILMKIQFIFVFPRFDLYATSVQRHTVGMYVLEARMYSTYTRQFVIIPLGTISGYYRCS